MPVNNLNSRRLQAKPSNPSALATQTEAVIDLTCREHELKLTLAETRKALRLAQTVLAETIRLACEKGGPS